MVVALNMKRKKQKKQCDDMCCFEGCSLLFKGKDADSAKKGMKSACQIKWWHFLSEVMDLTNRLMT